MFSKKFPPVRAGITLMLVLLIAAGQPGLSAPDYTIFGALTLYLDPTGSITLCRGASLSIIGTVTHKSDYVPLLPMPNATVTFSSELETATKISNAQGTLTYRFKPRESGEYHVSAIASRENYLPSDNLGLTVKVEECTWKIGFDYTEWLLAATGTWNYQASFVFEAFFHADEDGNLVLMDTSTINADYHATIGDIAEIYDCYLSQPVKGNASVSFKGHLQGQQLYIELSMLPIMMNGGQTAECDDIKSGDYHVEPFPAPINPSVDVFKGTGTQKVVLPATGGSKIFDVKKGIFWPYITSYTASGGAVVVWPEKEK
ncbi:MAG: hypothetical protein EHM70_16245 [Chloroflexota bacterium]|nr:MAG: hypothetical protein EHM70_16245 [Chloroflexota bacterium]